MLVLTRKVEESITIGDSIVITVMDLRGDKVRLGIDAPREVPVHRQEVYDAIQREMEEELDIEKRAEGSDPANKNSGSAQYVDFGRGYVSSLDLSAENYNPLNEINMNGYGNLTGKLYN